MRYSNNRVRHLTLAISGIFVASSNAYAEGNPSLQDEVQAPKKK